MNKAKTKTTTLTVEIEYNPRKTDPEGLACAMDRLLETALSTPGIMEEYGNPTVREFFVAKETAAAARAESRLEHFRRRLAGRVRFGPGHYAWCWWIGTRKVAVPSDNGIVEITDGRGGTQLANVAEYPVSPLEELAGTDTEAALKAAGLELTQPADRTVTRRWVLYDIDTNSLLTTRTYDSYDEAAEDANQVNDILVLPLEFEEIHASPTVEDADTVNDLDDTRCECEKPGFFCSGIPGILAHMENGRLAQGAQVNRCDLCQRYPSDEAAFEKLQGLGLVPPQTLPSGDQQHP